MSTKSVFQNFLEKHGNAIPNAELHGTDYEEFNVAVPEVLRQDRANGRKQELKRILSKGVDEVRSWGWPVSTEQDIVVHYDLLCEYEEYRRNEKLADREPKDFHIWTTNKGKEGEI